MGTPEDIVAEMTLEHDALGARWQELETGERVVATYAVVSVDQAREGCGVANLMGHTLALANDAPSQPLVTTAVARQPLAVGECGFGAVFLGDGRCASTPLCLRTGDHETLLLDASSSGETLGAWLTWVQSMEAQDQRAFPDATMSDQTDALGALVLTGPAAPEVLADYLRGQQMPDPGHVRPLNLDEIPAIVATLPVSAHSADKSFLLLVPPATLRVLWRSLMSFGQVVPVGMQDLAQLVDAPRPFSLGSAGELDPSDVKAYDLVRAQGPFIGSRAIPKEYR